MGARINGVSWSLTRYELVFGLIVLPGVMLLVGLIARHRGAGPIRFTGGLAMALNWG